MLDDARHTVRFLLREPLSAAALKDQRRCAPVYAR